MLAKHRWFRTQIGRTDGQVFTEFALILVVIAIALVTSLTLFAGQIKSVFQKSTDEIRVAMGGSSGSGTQLTSLGSTFSEISQGFIDAIAKYYAEHGKYPDNYKTRFTDLGLDPKEWDTRYPVDHMVWNAFGPGVAGMSVRPGPGYVFLVKDLSGNSLTLDPLDSSPNIWYVAQTNKWYYHFVSARNEINISTINILPKP